MPRAPVKHGMRQSGARKHVAKKPSDGEAWFYDRKWRKARSAHLAMNPKCEDCWQAGKLVAATVVDHVVPHKGDAALFWDATNWRSLCVTCHNRATAKYDGGFGRDVVPKPAA